MNRFEMVEMHLKKTNLSADYADYADYLKHKKQRLSGGRLKAWKLFGLSLICVNLRNLRTTGFSSLEGSL